MPLLLPQTALVNVQPIHYLGEEKQTVRKQTSNLVTVYRNLQPALATCSAIKIVHI